MDPFERFIIRFTRYCVNRAYVGLNTTGLSADQKTALDNVLDQLRSIELEVANLEQFKQVLNAKLPELFSNLYSQAPSVAVDLFRKLINYCLELEEVGELGLVNWFASVREVIEGKSKGVSLH